MKTAVEEVRKVTRTELFKSILSIVKQIPRKDVEGDAMDAPSCAYEIEQLFLKWQQEQDSKRLLFVYKVSLIIGLEKTGKLLKEVEKEINNKNNETNSSRMVF
jgi:hypothetical protein